MSPRAGCERVFVDSIIDRRRLTATVQFAKKPLLLDVTNLFINSRNHDFDPMDWLHRIEPEKELETLIHRQKERLDRFLMETLRIEKEQTQTNDVERLQGYLDSITRIKLQALQELTEEDLRGNQESSIFLDQCSYLIGRIQLKMLSQQSTKANA
jgi:hypothetical protein